MSYCSFFLGISGPVSLRDSEANRKASFCRGFKWNIPFNHELPIPKKIELRFSIALLQNISRRSMLASNYKSIVVRR